ncbi:PIG-L deacetylase family protein [Saccharolobus caldissimus]|uniref:PIG-L family deacetylase n=1 Tax=Saccharolobus caldissimus TaxID=1702097 RepID=A0AAQ4CPZ4_9CREN|nr:PIG-L family deacetylase [Saccharolobus caldissimus]BDB97875.1 PIG-L family deacetylase [Saccharolobus caldissimus]
MKVVFISPHPDDECDNAGGTLARLVKRGNGVYVIYLTDGSMGSPIAGERGKILVEKRKKEALEGLKVLGISNVPFFLDFPDSKLKFYINEAKNYVSEIFKSLSPDVVFYPSIFEAHPDHRAGYYIAKQAIIGLRISEFTYLNWPPLRRILWKLSLKRILVDIKEFKEVKLKAMMMHESQFKYLDRDYIRRFFETDFERFYVERLVSRSHLREIKG